ncbi:hypothetical protein ALC62_13439 [Cyphomyrmex costatus]|uniref:Uncharacterized protein n=1 Tax=Cyphomyrmex costatus TaxID=456900 RepID=A0A195C743_9HYME|nr:hypothetical protein ALC62_13439 [Cyphomyrmex costatus]
MERGESARRERVEARAQERRSGNERGLERVRRSIVAPSKMGGGWVEVGGSWVPWVAAEYGVIGEISRGSSTAANALSNRSEREVKKTVDRRHCGTQRGRNIGVSTRSTVRPGEKRRAKDTNGMLDFEQQTNQAQALASLDDDWHLLEGERTTFAIFFLPFLSLPQKVHGGSVRRWHTAQNLNPAGTKWEEKNFIHVEFYFFD